MKQVYNPIVRKQIIVMKNITIITYNYKVYLETKNKTIRIRKSK